MGFVCAWVGEDGPEDEGAEGEGAGVDEEPCCCCIVRFGVCVCDDEVDWYVPTETRSISACG